MTCIKKNNTIFMEIQSYKSLLGDIKQRIRAAQIKATFAANAEMIAMYWDIGQMIALRQKQQGWAASVIPRLSRDLKNELSEIKGFSERNLGYMVRFAKEYQNLNVDTINQHSPILQQPVAKLENADLLQSIPWGHHALLMEKIKNLPQRFWYMQQTLQEGWGRDTLRLMIKNDAYTRQGITQHNFNHPTDKETIGLILCQNKDTIIAEYALRSLQKPIGISEFELTRILPDNLKSSLPSIEDIENELTLK